MNVSVSGQASRVFDLYFKLSPHPGVLVENGLITEANRAFEGLVKKKKGQLINHNLDSVIHQPKGEFLLHAINNIEQGTKHFTFEINGARHDFNCKWWFTKQEDKESVLLLLEPPISFMVTSLEKELYEDLQDQRGMIELMIETEESERKIVSDFLHDEIGSMLATTKHQLDVVLNHIDSAKEKSKEELNRTIKLLDESIGQLRNIAMHNSPVSFEFGLVRAVTSLVDVINQKSLVRVKFISLADELNLTKSFEITIYRIIQELLNNSAKHSGATEIVLQLIKHESSINIVIEDNGKGFDYKKEKKKKDVLGLKRVKQRVELFNGKMQVDSSENSGSVITIELEF